mgnify:CR=1 FL=1
MSTTPTTPAPSATKTAAVKAKSARSAPIQVPRISKQEFARRRRDLMAQLEPNSIAIVPAALEKIRNRDTDYPFRQDSYFY